MFHEQHARGPASRLAWIAAAILLGGFVLVWGWNSGGAALVGGNQISYGQAVAAEIALAVMAAIVAMVTRGGGTHRWGSRHTKGTADDAIDHG